MQASPPPSTGSVRIRSAAGRLALCAVLIAALAACGGGGGAASSSRYLIGGTVIGLAGSGLVLQNNAGDDLLVAANGSFSFSTPLASGTAYDVTVKTQPSAPGQTCTVANGSGVVASAAIVSVAVTCAALTPAFVYISSGGAPNQLYGFTVDPATGALTANGTAATGAISYSVVVSPDQRFVYSSDQNANTIRAFGVNAATGALTAVAGSPFAAGSNVRGLGILPGGRFLVAVKQNVNSIAVHAIDAATGALGLQGAPIATDNQPMHISITPNGKYAYVANFTSRNVSAYAVDGALGTLAPIAGSPFGLPGASGSHSTAPEPRGKFLYVPDTVGFIFGFAIDDATGALTPVPGSPFAAAAPMWAAADPAGKYLYVSSGTGNAVLAYTIDAATGTLAPVAGSPFATDAQPYGVTADPGGKFILVTHIAAGTVRAHTINPATGALTSGASVAVPNPRNIAFVTR